MPENIDTSRIRMQIAAHNAHQGRFPRAVFADKSRNFSRIKSDVYIIESLLAAEQLLNIFYFNLENALNSIIYCLLHTRKCLKFSQFDLNSENIDDKKLFMGYNTHKLNITKSYSRYNVAL